MEKTNSLRQFNSVYNYKPSFLYLADGLGVERFPVD